MAILQAWLRIWTQDHQEQIQLAVREGLEVGVPELQVELSNRSPLSLLKVTHYHVIKKLFYLQFKRVEKLT